MVYVFDDGSEKALYLINYCKEEGLSVNVIGVNTASTLEEQFSKIKPQDNKVYLSYNYDDLRMDNELLRRQIQTLESKGWRNLIVLPFEGMDAVTMYHRIKTTKGLIRGLTEERLTPADNTLVGNDPASIEYEVDPKYVKTFRITAKGGLEEINKNDTKKRTERKMSDVRKEG